MRDMSSADLRVPTVEQPVNSHSALRELFIRVSESCDLPPLPAVAVRAIALARDPNVGADQLVRVVSTDAALAARVVSIARSVRYMRREAPHNLDGAIQTVGFQALRRILIEASARAAYRVPTMPSRRPSGSTGSPRPSPPTSCRCSRASRVVEMRSSLA